MKSDLSEIKEYLLLKVIDNDYNDDEYGFYLDIQKYGRKAIHMNSSTYRRVLKHMRKEYNGEI